MSHKTRSGKLYKPSWCADVVQDSAWADASDVLSKVLPAYLSQQDLVAGRAVCSAWRKAFGGNVLNLRLQRPTSAGAARSMSYKALKTFSNISTLHVKLLSYVSPTRSSRQSSSDDEAHHKELGKAAAVNAATALLQRCGKVPSLQHLELDVATAGQYTALPVLLPLLPQLHALDLTGCYHQSSDLLVIAEHLPQLRQLHLNCPSYTNIAGRKVDKGGRGCLLIGGFTPYKAEHIAALTRLPQLRLLEFPLPPCSTWQQRKECVEVLAQLTSLSSLHIISHTRSHFPMPLEAFGSLSALTGLTHLKASVGELEEVRYSWATSEQLQAVQVQHLQRALAGMQQLQTLELHCVILCDEVLQAVGSMQGLQRLVLDIQDMSEVAYVSSAGAAAVQHVAGIELVWEKGLTCSKTKPLLQLPNIKRLAAKHWHPAELFGPWSAEACICMICAWDRANRARQ